MHKPSINAPGDIASMRASAGPQPDCSLAAAAMWETLNSRQQELLSCMQEHRRLCVANIPDRASLGVARWRVAQAGRSRMEYLNGTIFPSVEPACAGEDLRRVVALRDATPAYQRQISAYVTRWPTNAIVTEWSSYKVAAEAFRSVILSRIAEEVSIFRPLMRQMALSCRGV